MQAAGVTAGPPARDPVCGREISVTQAIPRAEHGGTGYVFCWERYRGLFHARPDLFVARGLRVIVERAQER